MCLYGFSMTLKEPADEIMFYMLGSFLAQTFVDTIKKRCGWLVPTSFA